MSDENWQDDSIELSPALARRYGEARSIFLCRIQNSPVLEGRVNKISPNGAFAKIELHGPIGDQEVWMPLEECRVLDMLVPFVDEKEEAAKEKARAVVLEKFKAAGGPAGLIQAIFNETMPAPATSKPKPKKKGKRDAADEK